MTSPSAPPSWPLTQIDFNNQRRLPLDRALWPTTPRPSNPWSLLWALSIARPDAQPLMGCVAPEEWSSVAALIWEGQYHIQTHQDTQKNWDML